MTHGPQLLNSVGTTRDSKVYLIYMALQNETADQPVIQPQFIGHRVASGNHDSIDAILYEYLMAGNGLILRARRHEFTACCPLVRARSRVCRIHLSVSSGIR